jgi:PTH1 family peptidyl-tRNA hydrolase
MTLKFIVGLGNPGPTYARNRHNIGFQLVDALARANGLALSRRQGHARVGQGQIAGRQTLLAKPQTFMNLSGDAVSALMRFYKVTPADLLVAYDDLDLPLGKVRLRGAGGSGGHKGMKSIIERIGTEDFARLRIGIGRPAYGDAVDHVLQDFSAAEAGEIAVALDRAAQAAVVWLTEGIDAAMNRFNRAADAEGQPA